MTVLNKRITDYKVGSDPELFLVDKDNRQIISAIPYIPGDKYSPHQIPGLPEGNMMQVDNIMVEFCLPATKLSKEFYKSFKDCVNYTNSIVPATLELEVRQSGLVQESQLLDPRTQVFGCDPDFNVWMDGMQNDSIDSKTNLRTCGGHVHIGYNDPDMETSMNIIKALDIFLGIPSVILDNDRERKKMYGKAGAYRLKAYGVEYRSLSNFWLADEDIVNLVFNGIEMAIQFINENKLEKLTDEQSLKIQTCINTGDETLALELVNTFNLTKLLHTKMYID
jgi:hypothetical protein